MPLAHGIGGRQDLPIPLAYAVVGGALAVVASFLGLAVLWRTPRLGLAERGRPVPPGLQRFLDAPATRRGVLGLGVVATAYVVLAAAGPDLATNPTAGVVYVLFWVGLVPSSLLLGPVWRALNPLRAVHLLLCRLLRLDPDGGALGAEVPGGYRVAALWLLAFVWLELVAPSRTTLPVLRLWFGAYAAVQLVSALAYGRRWFARGDAFEVWSTLLGRLSVWGRRPDGRLVVRDPLDNVARLAPAPGLVAVVVVMLGSTAFDALSSAPYWFRFAQQSPLGTTATATLGLVAMCAAVGVLYVGATLLAGSLAGDGRRSLPGEFAHSLVPIAVGYLVAHYYSFLVLEGQRAVIRLSDPLVTGHSNWLGTAHWQVSGALIHPTPVAVLQVVAVVTGHVVGVVLAHDRAVRLFPRGSAVRGQLPLLTVMVAFTVGGLVLLFTG